VAYKGLKILDGVWQIRAERYWMECGIYGPKYTGWSVAIKLKDTRWSLAYKG
jgi:hypothetical protein